MAKLDTKGIQPLLGVCRLQAEIITEFAHLVSSDKIDELQQMFKAANLDEPLRKIQREAWEAGFIAGSIYGEDTVCATSLDNTVCDTFEQWVNDNG